MRNLTALTILLCGLGACSTDPTLGGSKGNVATGGAAGASSTGSNQLEHCSAPMGTLGVVEDTYAPWYAYLAQYHLNSTIPVLRTIVQQSNCFVLVERGRAMNNMMMERGLAQSGELRSGSNMGRGQMAAADYTMSPTINFSQQGTGGLGAAAGFIPYVGGVLSAAAASARSNEASTTLLLIDNRSGVQIAASQGSAKNWDIGGVGGLLGYGGGYGGAGGLGGFGNTPEGKLLTASFMDSYNQMVANLREYRAQNVQGGLGTGGTLGVQGGSTPASRRLRQ